ncbi:MAG: RsfS/YbeB/iojap family protein, partial [Smithellaceae bacterium]|nr:RsfS/YbeB/iojap family protein [Smithellaceae bacterium]
MPAKKNESARRLLLCINAVLQKKANNIVVLNVKEVSSFTDYMLICSGATDRQVQAVSNAIQ